MRKLYFYNDLLQKTFSILGDVMPCEWRPCSCFLVVHKRMFVVFNRSDKLVRFHHLEFINFIYEVFVLLIQAWGPPAAHKLKYFIEICCKKLQTVRGCW